MGFEPPPCELFTYQKKAVQVLIHAELRCYAVINVDKSAVSIGRQVNAYCCSSTHYP